MRTMSRRVFVPALASLVVAPRALAGGWATVRLDAPVTAATVDVPLRVSFLVKQHDREPADWVEPKVIATNVETNDQLEALAEPGAQPGRFLADLTFPATGSWKWQVIPEPFAGTAFPPIQVLSEGEAASAMSTGNEQACLDGVATTITINDASFAPSQVSVPQGETLRWHNVSSIAHSVMSDALTFPDSGVIEPGASFDWVTSEAGRFEIWCGPHPSMRGTITVEAKG